MAHAHFQKLARAWAPPEKPVPSILHPIAVLPQSSHGEGVIFCHLFSATSRTACRAAHRTILSPLSPPHHPRWSFTRSSCTSKSSGSALWFSSWRCVAKVGMAGSSPAPAVYPTCGGRVGAGGQLCE